VKTLKDPLKLISILNTLRPMSARLLLFFLLTKDSGKPFQYTLFQMSHDAQVKNPRKAVADILDKGYMSREQLPNDTMYTYTLHLDI
jgi:hypothetical protein